MICHTGIPTHTLTNFPCVCRFSEEQYNNVIEHFTLSRQNAIVGFLQMFNPSDIVMVQLKSQSDSVWGISPPSETSLTHDLLNRE